MFGWSRAAIACTSRAKSSAALPSATCSTAITLRATRRFKGGNCCASYTSPNVPEPIQLVTRQSPSKAPSSRYLQNWHVTCSSCCRDEFKDCSAASLGDRVASAGTVTDEDILIFLCGFLGFKQRRIDDTPVNIVIVRDTNMRRLYKHIIV